MFDFSFTKLNSIPVNAIVNNSNLDFTGEHNTNTGEISNTKKAKFRGLSFIVKNDKYINLYGSFHKYKNDGLHNYNDFTINDFVEVLNDLSVKFEINPFTASLHSLEFGVNVTLPFSVKMFLDAIISFKGKEYVMETYNGNGRLLRFAFQQYELKIYDKGLQNELGENILRFEIRVIKMEYFNNKSRNIGINNYTDLLYLEKIKILSEHLLSAFNELLIYDNTINVDAIESRFDRELYIKGQNTKYWSNLKVHCLKTYYRHLIRFRELNLKHGTNNLQKHLYELIKDKLRLITTIDFELQTKINNYLSEHKLKSVPILTDKLKHYESEIKR